MKVHIVLFYAEDLEGLPTSEVEEVYKDYDKAKEYINKRGYTEEAKDIYGNPMFKHPKKINHDYWHVIETKELI